MRICSINSALSFVGMTDWMFPILRETLTDFAGFALVRPTWRKDATLT